MAIPNHYLKRRDLLHGEKIAPATLAATGREFLAQERYSEALDFFEKAKDEAGIKAIKDFAVKTGECFLLARLERYDPALITRAEFEAGAARAMENGKPSLAGFVERKLAAEVKKEERPGDTPIEEV